MLFGVSFRNHEGCAAFVKVADQRYTAVFVIFPVKSGPVFRHDRCAGMVKVSFVDDPAVVIICQTKDLVSGSTGCRLIVRGHVAIADSLAFFVVFDLLGCVSVPVRIERFPVRIIPDSEYWPVHGIVFVIDPCIALLTGGEGVVFVVIAFQCHASLGVIFIFNCRVIAVGAHRKPGSVVPCLPGNQFGIARVSGLQRGIAAGNHDGRIIGAKICRTDAAPVFVIFPGKAGVAFGNGEWGHIDAEILFKDNEFFIIVGSAKNSVSVFAGRQISGAVKVAVFGDVSFFVVILFHADILIAREAGDPVFVEPADKDRAALIVIPADDPGVTILAYGRRAVHAIILFQAHPAVFVILSFDCCVIPVGTHGLFFSIIPGPGSHKVGVGAVYAADHGIPGGGKDHIPIGAIVTLLDDVSPFVVFPGDPGVALGAKDRFPVFVKVGLACHLAVFIVAPLHDGVSFIGFYGSVPAILVTILRAVSTVVIGLPQGRVGVAGGVGRLSVRPVPDGEDGLSAVIVLPVDGSPSLFTDNGFPVGAEIAFKLHIAFFIIFPGHYSTVSVRCDRASVGAVPFPTHGFAAIGIVSVPQFGVSRLAHNALAVFVEVNDIDDLIPFAIDTPRAAIGFPCQSGNTVRLVPGGKYRTFFVVIHLVDPRVAFCVTSGVALDVKIPFGSDIPVIVVFPRQGGIACVDGDGSAVSVQITNDRHPAIFIIIVVQARITIAQNGGRPICVIIAHSAYFTVRAVFLADPVVSTDDNRFPVDVVIPFFQDPVFIVQDTEE